MLADFFVNCPSPLLAGVYGPGDDIPPSLGGGMRGGTMWSALSIGGRLQHGFAYYSVFADSPYFTEDVRAQLIFSMPEMADVLERMKGAGNWATQMAEALMAIGFNYPEYKRAKVWAEKGVREMVQNALDTIYPDGCLREPTMGYHQFVAPKFGRVVRRCREMGIEIDPKMVGLTEKMFEVVMYACHPSGLLPVWGDADNPLRPYSLEMGAELFERDDFRYVLSGGKEGKPPAKTSVGFPNGGFYYLRDGWKPDAQYMGIRCGYFGSHGHHDALSVVASAFGRTVLIDPGVYTYGTEVARELQQTRSHNTVTVDDSSSIHAECDAWVTAEHFDLFAGHNLGYRDKPDILHRREVWFLKGEAAGPPMWMILDAVHGEGEHRVDMGYRFAPVKVAADADRCAVWTTERDRNIWIGVAADVPMITTLGEELATWEDLVQVPQARFATTAVLPVRMVSLLAPAEQEARPWNLTALPVRGRKGLAAWATQGEHAVLAVQADVDARRVDNKHRWQVAIASRPAEVTLPNGRTLRVEGGAAVLRFVGRADEWQPLSVFAMGAADISLDGTSLGHPTGEGKVWDRILVRD